MPRFIVLAGKKQSGKTTSAKYLKQELLKWRSDLNIKITSFASPIKDFCLDVIGLTEEQVYGTDEQKNSPTHIMWDTMPPDVKGYEDHGKMNHVNCGPMTAREVMQAFGTDIMRTYFDYNIWSKAPFNKAWDLVDYVIIDDCRFPNEATEALEHDGMLIKLTRNVRIADNHSSELALDDYAETNYTHIIDNHGYENIDSLYADLDAIVVSERYR